MIVPRNAFSLIPALVLALGVMAPAHVQGQILAPGDAQTCSNGSGDRAIEACSRAIASGQFSGVNLGNIYFTRGMLYARKRDNDRALADYNETIRLAPGDAEAHFNRALVHYRKQDADRAIADLNEGIRLNPKDAIAFLQRARVHSARKEFSRAVADYDEAIRLNPSYAEDLARERNAAAAAKK